MAGELAAGDRSWPRCAPLLELRDLLLLLFQPDELRMFLHLKVDPSLVQCLPAEGVSPELLAYRASVALEQRGYVADELFRRLSEERPLRATEIEAVATRLAGRVSAVRALDAASVANVRAIADELEEFVAALASERVSDRIWDSRAASVRVGLRRLRSLLGIADAGHPLADLERALAAASASEANARPKTTAAALRARLRDQGELAAVYARVLVALNSGS